MDVPCARCGKPDYTIGKLTQYGPVCNSCSVYFRLPRTLVGSVSVDSKLDSSAGAALETVERTYATCRSCRRHRRIASEIDGTPFCKACTNNGPIACKLCGNEMPAGRGKRCETCYWKDTFSKRLALDEAGLSEPKMVAIFREFGQWLISAVPAQKAAQSIHRYFPFFFEMNQQWGKVPGYAELLAHFSAEGLRRVRLPMRWLSEAELVVVDNETREDASEKRRIDAISSLLPAESSLAAILVDYKEGLFARMKEGKTTLRTVRMLLQPAAALLIQCEDESLPVTQQRSVDRYLANVPGQRNNISGFVSFINRKYGISLSVDHKSQQAGTRRKRKLEAELVALIADARGDASFRNRWLSVALAYFHGLPRNVGKSLADEKIVVLADGSFSATLEGKQYWVPCWNYRVGSNLIPTTL